MQTDGNNTGNDGKQCIANLRAIEVVRYGTDGYIPKEKHLCVHKGKKPCESDSDGAVCDGHYGIKQIGDRVFVLCDQAMATDKGI